jgi:hypothetical protein
LTLGTVTTFGAGATITVTVTATAALLARLTTRGAVAGLGRRLTVCAGGHALGLRQSHFAAVAFGHASLIGPA